MNTLSVPVQPDYEELLQVIRREKTPRRVHHIEIFHDPEVFQAICDRFGVGSDLDPADPDYQRKRGIAFQRFIGYDHVMCGVAGAIPPINVLNTDDASEDLTRASGRNWVDEHSGRIKNWDDFEQYPWETFTAINTAEVEWYSANLPDDMMIIGAGIGHYAEYLCWLFGHESLCYAIYDAPDLVRAVKVKLEEAFEKRVQVLTQFDRVKVIWGFDDMGFKTGLLLGVPATRELVLPGHKRLAQLAHESGRPYMLHCCGNIHQIIDELIDDVKLDAKHSFEDTIEDVRELKSGYGSRVALLGGIDVDFLCRADEQAIRKRVRETIDVCLPGGGWVLGTGNSVANYIPLDNYLAMLDEGRRYSA
jgi:uroporphyrinogen decarboxylase